MLFQVYSLKLTYCTSLQITEELDQVKQEMDERGSNMTDGSKLPL